MADADVLA